MKILHAVGLITSQDPFAWSLKGVYTDEKEAIAECVTNQHFVGPLPVNKSLPTDGDWPGAYYPVDDRKMADDNYLIEEVSHMLNLSKAKTIARLEELQFDRLKSK